MASKNVARKDPRSGAGADDAEHNKLMEQAERMLAEEEPLLCDGLAEKLEKALNGAGDDAVNRRIALAFLSRPMKEMAKKIVDDAETARAFAEAANAVQLSAGIYREVAKLMEKANTRMVVALCQRKDGLKLLGIPSD